MTSVQSKSAGQSRSSTSAKSRGRTATGGSQEQTGERDENYGLISVLYHALQGAETTAQYVQSSRASGDEEVVQFLERTRSEYKSLAADARRLLVERLQGSDGGESDDEDEPEDEDE
jgi:hypothetical protein